MTDANAASRANLVLLFVVGLLAGGILGYIVGRQSANPTEVAPTGAASVVLNDVLPVQDAWIVEGFSCPMPGCSNPLLTCSGELPRRIRDWVNSQRAAGRPGADIRAEIERVHGANLHKLTGSTGDTARAGK
jgi:hypothetical protein